MNVEKPLLMIERVVLESLSFGPKSLLELGEDTGLGNVLLTNILQELEELGYVGRRDELYVLTYRENDVYSPSEEVKELVNSMVDNYFLLGRKQLSDHPDVLSINLRKVWLSPMENKILHSYLANVREFILGIEKQQRKCPPKAKLCERKVLFWGVSDYARLIEGTLETV